MTTYTLTATVGRPYDETVAAVRDALARVADEARTRLQAALASLTPEED